MNEYQCVFCGKKIDKEKEKVTSLLITANWEKEEAQEDQQVFCHLTCLKKKCAEPKSIFLEDEGDS